jgi:hypothetical protein
MTDELDKVMKTFDLVFMKEEQEEDLNGRFLPPIRKEKKKRGRKTRVTV